VESYYQGWGPWLWGKVLGAPKWGWGASPGWWANPCWQWACPCGPKWPKATTGGAIVSHPTLALGWVHWGPRCVCARGGPGTLAPPRMQPLLLWPLACCLCAHPCTNMPVWEAWLCCNRKSDLCPLALASCSQIPSKVASLSVAAPRRPPHLRRPAVAGPDSTSRSGPLVEWGESLEVVKY